MDNSIQELKKVIEVATKKQGDDLLSKVLNITAKSDVRTKTLEAMSDRSDTILRQLITNQEKQSVDMDKQHGFIANMNTNFSKTTAQVEKLQQNMTANQAEQSEELGKQYRHIENMNMNFTKTAAQVDKLQNTMSIFMRRISASINSRTSNNTRTNTDNMEDLHEYLEKDDMEIDSVLGKRPPSADIDSLRDGGVK